MLKQLLKFCGIVMVTVVVTWIEARRRSWGCQSGGAAPLT